MRFTMLRQDSRLKPLVRRSLSETSNKQAVLGSEEMTQVTECWSDTRQALGLIPITGDKGNMAVHACNHGSGRRRKEDGEFEAGLSYTDPV